MITFLDDWRGRARSLAAFGDSITAGDRLILPDHVHPNVAGHSMIAEIFAGATKV
jgi:hypothetical protein